MLTRQMKSAQFRAIQEGCLRESHIAPLTALVDRLRTEKGQNVPYVAPTFGGRNARVLLLFQDPGPATKSSGMLCHQNDDPSAARLTRLLHAAEIAPEMCNAWNAYPWYINRKPTTAEIREGLSPLAAVLDLMGADRGHIHAYLGGKSAHDSWDLLKAARPDLGANVRAFYGRHTSNMGVTISGMKRKEVEEKIVLPVFKELADSVKRVVE